MKNTFLIILSFLSVVAYSQKASKAPYKKPHHKVRKSDYEKENLNHRCRETIQFSVSKRRKLYPFNQANKIELVAFEDIYNYKNNFDPDTTPSPRLQLLKYSSKYRNNSTIKSEQEFNLPPFVVIKTLGMASKDSLSHILFNIKYAGVIYSNSTTKCYQPRNAILFYDKDGGLLEYLEICFTCDGNRLSWKAKNIDWCDSKYKNLKQIFRQNGVEFGTN